MRVILRVAQLLGFLSRGLPLLLGGPPVPVVIQHLDTYRIEINMSFHEIVGYFLFFFEIEGSESVSSF